MRSLTIDRDVNGEAEVLRLDKRAQNKLARAHGTPRVAHYGLRRHRTEDVLENRGWQMEVEPQDVSVRL